MTGQRVQQEAICYQWFKQRLILSVSEPSISQRSQIKEDTVEPSVPSREFNLKAYAAITWHNDLASLGLEPILVDHCRQAARTATLPTAPLRQASVEFLVSEFSRGGRDVEKGHFRFRPSFTKCNTAAKWIYLSIKKAVWSWSDKNYEKRSIKHNASVLWNQFSIALKQLSSIKSFANTIKIFLPSADIMIE